MTPPRQCPIEPDKLPPSVPTIGASSPLPLCATPFQGCVFFRSDRVRCRPFRMGQCWNFCRGRKTGECVMPYCITLRSRTDATVTGWYAGRNCRWSTDRQRQIRFDNPDHASAVCQELRSLCPRNASVINIELAQNDPHVGVGPRRSRTSPYGAGTHPDRSAWSSQKGFG